MTDRITFAENFYSTLLTGVGGINQAKACSISQASKVTASPWLNFYLNNIKWSRFAVLPANDMISSFKTMMFRGILWTTSGGASLDDARLVAYPIIPQLRAALDGAIMDVSGDSILRQEMVGPTYVTDEGPVMIETGRYAWMLCWEFEMQFTKGVAG